MSKRRSSKCRQDVRITIPRCTAASARSISRLQASSTTACPVDLEDFNSRIVLVYSGKPRNSGINNWEVTKAHIDGDKTVFKNFERIAAISHALRTALAKPDWDEAARLIREEWSHRRKNAPGITTEFIDKLVATAKRSGGGPRRYAAQAAEAASSSL